MVRAFFLLHRNSTQLIMGLFLLGRDAPNASLMFGVEQDQHLGFLPSSDLVVLVLELVFGNDRWRKTSIREHKYG